MSNIIFYFSGSGNSLAVARHVADSIEDFQFISMAKQPETIKVATKDKVGFIFPVYCCGMPNIVKRFVRRVDLSGCKEAYFFSLVTCGNFDGNALGQINSLLHDKGIYLNYGNKVKISSNFKESFCKNLNDPDTINEITTKNLQGALNDIILEKSKHINKGSYIIQEVHKKYSKSIRGADKKFKVSDLCISCGRCAKVCPVNNIEMKDGKPTFKHNCEQCFACMSWCPTSSICINDWQAGASRYHHPEITFKDMTGE